MLFLKNTFTIIATIIMASFIKQNTSKEKDSIIVDNYLYYSKEPNKDSSVRYACKESYCSASVTILDDEIIKINSKKPDNTDSETIKASHKNQHLPSLSDKDVIQRDFRNRMKQQAIQQPTAMKQLYQQERSKILKATGDMDHVAQLPEFDEIKSSLFKTRSNFSTQPPVPKTTAEINIEGEYRLCEDSKYS